MTEVTPVADQVVTPELRNISNSEVTTFLTCKRMYEYAFMYNLEPKETSAPLSRGTLGHAAFEAYVNARLNSSPHEQALKAADPVFQEALKHINIDIVMKTQYLFNRYMSAHNGWPEWKLLGTEQRLDVKLTDTLNMPIRYDVYVEEVRTGKRLIGDYKFTYDFWTPDEHDLNGQMPKYIVVMQMNGLQVDGGFLEEVRTRELGKDKSADPKNLWRRTFYYPSIAKKRSMFKQHVAASLEIERFRNLPEKERKDAAIPVLNKHGGCKYCNFKDLCNSENEGKTDLTVDIRTNYVENTYGYNKQIIEEV